jgi:hypothetical protein
MDINAFLRRSQRADLLMDAMLETISTHKPKPAEHLNLSAQNSLENNTADVMTHQLSYQMQGVSDLLGSLSGVKAAMADDYFKTTVNNCPDDIIDGEVIYRE